MALLVAVLAGAAVAAGGTPAHAVPGGDRFLSGVPYDGEFASPDVWLDGDRYVGYATNVDGNNLPVETSSDLATWTPRAPLASWQRYSSWSGYHDALPRPAAWAARRLSGGVWRYGIWAPSVARMGGHYVLAYAAMVDFARQRLCISLAHSGSALGVFTDDTTRPIVCSSDPHGSIDPDLLRIGTHNYLIWKNAGVPGEAPTRIWVRRLNAKATGFFPGSRPHLLLSTRQPWEGNVVEAPAMVRYAGHVYLFYSGNTYTTGRYATGYAMCDSVLGPCRRVRSTPLLASDDALVGPGGATPFVDKSGRLRLAYHAWTAGHVGYTADPSSCVDTPDGCNQRRLHLALLRVVDGGHLEVAERG